MTKRIINAALRRAGLPLEIQHECGAGYSYFTKDGVHVGESVMVCYLHHLTVEEWVDRARFAIEDDMDSLHPTL